MDPEKLSRNEARSGESPGVVRYILVISIALVVVGMAVAFMFYV